MRLAVPSFLFALEFAGGEALAHSLFGAACYIKLQRYRWLAAPVLFGQHAAVVELLVRHYAHQGRRVLDLGARRSPYTSSLRGMVVGLDLPAEDKAKLGFTRQSLDLFTSDHRVPVFGQGEFLPFANDTFDAVIMIEVIEHIEGDREAVQEVTRVLKPDGVLVLTTPNGRTFPVPSQHHLRHYTSEALEALIGSQLKIERFWCLFPKGRLWEESVRSVKKILRGRNVIALIGHCLAVWIYWLYTCGWFLAGKVEGTSTLCLVARKSQAQPTLPDR